MPDKIVVAQGGAYVNAPESVISPVPAGQIGMTIYDAFGYVDEGFPNVSFPGVGNINHTTNPGIFGPEQQCFYHLATSIPAGLILDYLSYPFGAGGLAFNAFPLGITNLVTWRFRIALVAQNFNVATLTWNNAPSVANVFESFIQVVQGSSIGSAALPWGGQPQAIALAQTVFGIRFSVRAENTGGAAVDYQIWDIFPDPTGFGASPPYVGWH